MKNGQCRLVLGSCFLALLLLPTAVLIAQTTPPPPPSTSAPTPREEALAIEGDLGFGHLLKTGRPALAVDTSAVFCPDPAVFVLNQADEVEVKRSFNATDLGNGTWEVPDPETNQPVTVSVQYAAALYNDSGTTSSTSSLPVLSTRDVSVLPLHWNRCWRLRRGYRCGVTATCPTGCFSGYKYGQLRNFLVCRWTGLRTDLCLDFLAPVCRIDRYTCRDCTGPILASWLNYRYVCALF